MGVQCETCDRIFGSYEAAEQHMNALDHWDSYQCDTCDRVFGSSHAVEQHMDALSHWGDGYNYECGLCGDYFSSESDRYDHEIEECYYCSDCDREFYSEQAIQQVRICTQPATRPGRPL